MGLIYRVPLLVALGALALYLMLLLSIWRYQERIVFQPPRSAGPGLVSPVAATAAGREIAVRQVSYRASDGTALFAYLVGEPTASGTLLIAFHGNADLARLVLPWAAAVVQSSGVAVLVPEYRGYDGLEGQPTYATVAGDALAALAFARDSLGVPPDRIALFGHSLGSAIATELADTAPVRVVILQSPFSSTRAMAQRLALPGVTFFWSVISRVHYDTERRVRRLQATVWVAHGDRDNVVPVRMGRAVYAAAARRGQLLIVHGAGHNDVAERGGAAYWEWMRQALSP